MKLLHYSDYADPNVRSLYEQCDLFITTGDLDLNAFFDLEMLEPKKFVLIYTVPMVIITVANIYITAVSTSSSPLGESLPPLFDIKVTDIN